jgi:hypothetical protein
MKKILIFTLLIIAFSATYAAKFSKDGKREKEFVSTFLAYMKHGDGPNYYGMMKNISPKYIKSNQIDVSDYKVNNYSIEGFEIESYNRTGLVTTKIWGNGKSWTHRVVFKLIKYKGKFYMDPSKHSDKYIDPWYTVETYIKN